MKTLSLLLVCFLAIAHASERTTVPLQTSILRLRQDYHINCDSWRLGEETNNIRNWRIIPKECVDYVENYMIGNLYQEDSRAVVDEAIDYLESLNLSGRGKKIAWVFDIDETTLSNLPHYIETGLGTLYNSTKFNEWVLLGEAPVLPESLKLYNKLLSLNVKVIFITGRPEAQRNITETNLKQAGYHTWEDLVLRSPSQAGVQAVTYKSGERKNVVKQGMRIIGNIGDQWSDILGSYVGERTFKLPNPMYYIA